MGPRKEFAVCEEYPLVPRFEGEEDNRAETMDLPIAHGSPASIESPVAENFDPMMCIQVEESSPSVTNPFRGCVRFSEGLETHYDASTTHISFLELFLVVWNYEKGQEFFEGKYERGGLTLEIGHLVRPPGYVIEGRWSLSSLLCSLIAVVDACHVTLLTRRVSV
jgi:hypothetical protein